jgi:Domain of unknown function (DUF3576)
MTACYTVGVNKVLHAGTRLMISRVLAIALMGTLVVTGCQSGRGEVSTAKVAATTLGTVNPYLWRASLDTFENMPVTAADPLGGLISYDWKSFPDSPNERIKATVFILDTRLRADGVKVSVFRQINQGGTWVDAPVDPETGTQLENRILERARSLKASQLG